MVCEFDLNKVKKKKKKKPQTRHGLMAQDCNLSTLEMETGTNVQGQPWPHSESKACLSFSEPFFSPSRSPPGEFQKGRDQQHGESEDQGLETSAQLQALPCPYLQNDGIAVITQPSHECKMPVPSET